MTWQIWCRSRNTSSVLRPRACCIHWMSLCTSYTYYDSAELSWRDRYDVEAGTHHLYCGPERAVYTGCPSVRPILTMTRLSCHHMTDMMENQEHIICTAAQSVLYTLDVPLYVLYLLWLGWVVMTWQIWWRSRKTSSVLRPSACCIHWMSVCTSNTYYD